MKGNPAKARGMLETKRLIIRPLVMDDEPPRTSWGEEADSAV